jgi:hypothetical protein
MRQLLDRIGLLLAGLVASAGAWWFWSHFGQEALDLFAIFVMIVLYADNRQLRKRLRDAGLPTFGRF